MVKLLIPAQRPELRTVSAGFLAYPTEIHLLTRSWRIMALWTPAYYLTKHLSQSDRTYSCASARDLHAIPLGGIHRGLGPLGGTPLGGTSHYPFFRWGPLLF